MSNWLVLVLLGAWGGSWDDPFNPPRWCIACNLIIGAIAAVIIYPLVASQLRDAGFVGVAVTSFAAGRVVTSAINAGRKALTKGH